MIGWTEVTGVTLLRDDGAGWRVVRAGREGSKEHQGRPSRDASRSEVLHPSSALGVDCKAAP